MAFENVDLQKEIAPGAVVQAQLDAYNVRDIEAFCACYSENVEIMSFPDGAAILKGMAAFRERYMLLFADCATLHCHLLARIVCGNIVFDEERVVRSPGESELYAVAIYEVVDGKIARVWFARPD